MTYPVAPVLPPYSPSETSVVVRRASGTVHPTGGYDRIEVMRQSRVTRNGRLFLAQSTDHWLGGKKHRLDGPASRVIDPQSGRVISETYFIGDRLSRISGPASITGGREKWWLRRRSFESGRELRSYVLSLHEDDDFRAAIADSELWPLVLEGFSLDDVRGAIEAEVWTPEGLRALLGGAPAEWARAFEHGVSS